MNRRRLDYIHVVNMLPGLWDLCIFLTLLWPLFLVWVKDVVMIIKLVVLYVFSEADEQAIKIDLIIRNSKNFCLVNNRL